MLLNANRSLRWGYTQVRSGLYTMLASAYEYNIETFESARFGYFGECSADRSTSFVLAKFALRYLVRIVHGITSDCVYLFKFKMN